MRLPSGDQAPYQNSSSSEPFTRTCGSSPCAPITQRSWKPLPPSRWKAIRVPSGETSEGCASSQSWRGGPPRAETTQALERTPTSILSTTNLVPSGNHPLGHQLSGYGPSPSGRGTLVVSPVRTTFKCSPIRSPYARYFPSGDMTPLVSVFSRELVV